MKRFKTFLIAFAVFTGTFAPVTATVSSFHVSPTIQKAAAQNAPVPAYNPEKAAQNIQANLDCGVSWLGNGSLTGCLAWFVYAIPYTVGAYLLTTSAQILDSTAALTLSSKLFSASSFVADGWRLTRDLSNMFFIFILLYIAISMVLGLDTGVNPKKMLISVVVIALMINFSMLITKVVIDTSNSLALLFYNQITVKSKVTGKDAEVAPEMAAITANSGVKQQKVSESLAQGFNPHIFQSAEFFENLKTPTEPTVSQMKMIFVLLMVGSMFCVAAYAFFISSLSFIGRLIMLMVSIIFAPVAFITYIIPSLKGKEGFGWSSWWSTLFSTAFAAPIYFFFILLISILAKSPMVSVTASGDSMITLITLFISFMILIVLLLKATAYAKKASGELGAKISGLGASALTLAGGYALGAATGGVAMGAQQTVGRLGKRISESETLKDMSVAGGSGRMDRFKRYLAKGALTGGDTAANRSYNLPNTSVGKLIESKTGLKFSQPKTIGGVISNPLSNERLAGGVNGVEKRRKEKIERQNQLLGYNKDKQFAIEEATRAEEKNLATIKQNLVSSSEDIKQQELLVNQGKETVTQHTAALTSAKQAFQSAEAALKRAQEENAKSGIRDASGVPLKSAAVLKAERDALAAKTTVEQSTAILSQSEEAQKKNIEALNAAVAKVKEGKKKMSDIERTIATLNKEGESNKKARTNANFYHQMAGTGFEVRGTRVDQFGNIADAGYLNKRQAARKWIQKAIEDQAPDGTITTRETPVAEGRRKIIPSTAVFVARGVRGALNAVQDTVKAPEVVVAARSTSTAPQVYRDMQQTSAERLAQLN